METTRTCTKCSITKPIEEYYVIKGRQGYKDYTYRYCKQCHYDKHTKHTAKKWREDNPEAWKRAAKKASRDWLGRMDAGVYLIFSTKGLYVGQSDHIKARIQEHKISKRKGCIGYKGAKYLFHVVLEYEDDKKKRIEIENYYIDLFRPKLNVYGNPNHK